MPFLKRIHPLKKDHTGFITCKFVCVWSTLLGAKSAHYWSNKAFAPVFLQQQATGQVAKTIHHRSADKPSHLCNSSPRQNDAETDLPCEPSKRVEGITHPGC